MLHVFVGDDVVRVRARAHAFLAHSGDMPYEHITGETYAPQSFREHVSATPLFGEVSPVLVDFISEDAEALADFETTLAVCGEASRVIVVMDTKPKAALEKKIRAHATSFEEVSGAAQKKERFNTFLLADALARKDKKSLWVLLVRAQMADVAGEEIAGTLFWQLKALRVAREARSAEEAGMKEFVYKKAKAAAKGFTKEELEALSTSLLTVYHDGHFDSDMEVGLERFVLTI